MNKNELPSYHEYKFVGNIDCRKDLSHLKDINYKIGDQAYDLDGKKIPTNYCLPLFIHKDDFKKYDDIMMSDDYVLQIFY